MSEDGSSNDLALLCAKAVDYKGCKGVTLWWQEVEPKK